MAYNENVESFRSEEYPMLNGKTYLDHGGATIYAKSLIESFSREMVSNLYGNPHSASEPAALSGHMVDDVRRKALQFFGADPEHFDLVFVANATSAIKLVMDCFRDLSTNDSSFGDFQYFYHRDSHTSLVGVREATRNHSCFRSDQEVEDWLDGNFNAGTSTDGAERPCLFAYPGQSNMTGRRLPLSWPGKLRHSSLRSHQNAYTLLDAAALATTSSLEGVFSDPDMAPDFTALSFYKIFGFPDLGALIVRRESDHILSWRKYFGGGTIDMITVLDQALHFNREGDVHNRLEDGTLGFHNILALGCAIDVHRRLYGDMNRVSRHVSYLGHRLYTGLMSLRHHNGKSLCDIYNEPGNQYDNSKKQGGTVAFNIKQANGAYVPFTEVEAMANTQNIYLRAGGLCNPGGIVTYLSLSLWQMKRAWAVGHRCTDSNPKIIYGKPLGVVRASLGAMSTISDVDTLLNWLASTYLEKPTPTPTPAPRSITSSRQNNQTILGEVNQVPLVPSFPVDRQMREIRPSELNLPLPSSRSGSKIAVRPVQSDFRTRCEFQPLVTSLPSNGSHLQLIRDQSGTVPNTQLNLGFDWTDSTRISNSQAPTLAGTSDGYEEANEQTRPWLSTAEGRPSWDTGEDSPLTVSKPWLSKGRGSWDGGSQVGERRDIPTHSNPHSKPWVDRPRGSFDAGSARSITGGKEKKGLRNLWRGRKGSAMADHID